MLASAKVPPALSVARPTVRVPCEVTGPPETATPGPAAMATEVTGVLERAKDRRPRASTTTLAWS